MQFSVQILPQEFCMINIDIIITVNATLIFTQLKVTFIINIGMNVQKKVQKFLLVWKYISNNILDCAIMLFCDGY
jgi:hypothetical protein